MQSVARPYYKAELADDLSQLNNKTIETTADIAEWNGLAGAVRERLAASDLGELGTLPDALTDYLSDAGLHFTDPEYGAALWRIVGRLIERLRQESETQRIAVG